jgi:integration host factor subunit alpha
MSTPKTPSKSSPMPGNSLSAKGNSRGALTRLDIALAVSDRCEGLSRRECKRLVDSVIEEMGSALIHGEILKLHDFGSFTVREKQQRTGRNPRTGAKVPIEARKVVAFRASPNMRALVNGDAPVARTARRAAIGNEGADAD